MAISSANPDDLNKFVTEAGSATSTLSRQINQLISAAESFRGTEATVNASSVNSTLQSFITQNGQDESFVKGVHDAFVAADSGTVPDSVIAAQLQKEGVSTSLPGVPTIDDPTLNGLPINSGWSNDPVCMATGHFAEEEQDLLMPGSLSVLTWSRVYNSRFIADGPLGRGWSSWADAVLVETSDGVVNYRGPDGQLAVWVAQDGGFQHNPGVAADLARTDAGIDICWRWTSRHPGARWSFGADGRLVSLSEPGRGTVSASYDGDRLVELRHDGGRALALSWDGGRLTAVTTSDGRRVEYRYEGSDLVEARRPTGAVTYNSDGGGRILEVFDADGVRLVRNEFDPSGRVLVQESAQGRVTHFDYLGNLTVLVRDEADGPRTLFRHDLLGRLVELTTAQGTRLVRHYDRDGNPVRVVGLAGEETLRSFDDRGNVLSARYPGGDEERYAYDEHSRLVERVDAAGAGYEFFYGTSDGSPSSLPSRITGPLGWFVDYEIVAGQFTAITDADGVSWRFELDADGQIRSVTDGEGSRTLLERHPSGELAAITTPCGHRHVLERDDAGRPRAVRSAAGATYLTEWSDAGRPTLVVGPDGERREMRYGPDGELAEVIDPLGVVTALEYDIWGNMISARRGGGAPWKFDYDGLGRPVSLVDPTGSTWQQHFDPAGNFVGVFDPTGFGVVRRFDGDGRLTDVERPSSPARHVGYGAGGLASGVSEGEGERARRLTSVERDALGRVVAATDAVGRRVTYEYSPAGRVLRATVAGAAGADDSWSYAYDRAGRLCSVTSPSGERTEVSYDADGRPVETRDASGGVERRVFDPDGRLRVVVDAAGGRTIFSYDGGLRVTGVAREGGPSTGCRYDAAGRVVQVTDGLGAATTFERDEWGVVTEVTDPKGATWSWELDAASRPIGALDPLGRRHRLDLDAAGRLVGWQRPDDSVLRYTWRDGLLRSISSPADAHDLWQVDSDPEAGRTTWTSETGPSVTEERDPAGRILRRQVGDRVTTWRYDDVARTIAMTTPSGEVVTRTFDRDGRVVSVHHAAVGTIEVRRDAAGRVVSVLAGGLRRDWTYKHGLLAAYREELHGDATSISLVRDLAGRVVREERDGVVRAFSYDSAGQLISLSSPERTVEWLYDSCGRLVEERCGDDARRFEYDAADQLQSVVGDGAEKHYEWDGLGRRVAERSEAGAVRYEWDALGHLTALHDEVSGRTTRLCFDAAGQLCEVDGQPVDWDDAGGLFGNVVAIGDRLLLAAGGSPVALVGADGVHYLRADWRGDVGVGGGGPWGEASGSVGPGFLGELEVGPLVWLRRRAYDPSTHSFISRDPLSGLAGTPGGLTNGYGYAANDPMSWADPLGLKPMTMSEFTSWRQSEQAGHWKTVAEWAAVAVIVVGSAALIAASGGAAIPVLAAAADAGGASIMTAAGLGGLFGVGGTAFDDAIHGAPVDPNGLIAGGVSGMVVGGLTAGVPGMVLPAETSIPAYLGVQAGTSAVASAGTNAVSQQLLYGRVDAKTVAIAGGTGFYAGAWPGADVAPAADGAAPAAASGAEAATKTVGERIFGPATKGQGTIINTAMGIHATAPVTIVQAATDGAGATPTHTPPAPGEEPLHVVAHLRPASYYAAGGR